MWLGTENRLVGRIRYLDAGAKVITKLVVFKVLSDRTTHDDLFTKTPSAPRRRPCLRYVILDGQRLLRWSLP